MGYGVLDILTQLGERLLITVGHEYRIIAETGIPLLFFGNGTLYPTLEFMNFLAWFNPRLIDRTQEPG